MRKLSSVLLSLLALITLSACYNYYVPIPVGPSSPLNPTTPVITVTDEQVQESITKAQEIATEITKKIPNLQGAGEWNISDDSGFKYTYNKDGKPNDDTFETTKKLIDVPIVYVSYDDCEDMLKEFLRYKETYNKIKDKHCERQLEPHHVKELYEHLYIDTMRRDYLHTLIMLEDATEFMRSKSANYVNDLMTKCRHIQCSFFVIVHFWKALSPNLKSNLSMIYIFGGYSRQQLNYITYQINVSETSQRLWQIYSRLREHQKLVIDSNLCQLKVF